MIIWIDTETFNTRENDIKAVGTVKYAQTCELLLVTLAVDHDKPIVVDYTSGETLQIDQHGMRVNTQKSMFWELSDVSFMCVAQNAMFDRHVLGAKGIVPHDVVWQDNMARCLTMGLPASLAGQCEALGIAEDQAKLSEGKKLINRFCKPAPDNHKAERYTKETHPDEWARFIEYAKQDIVAMREVWKKTPGWNYR